MSASASTLTEKNLSTPHACSICTAAAENPHCGNCGVPFKYNTTGCPVTCSRIFSWMVMLASWLRLSSVALRYHGSMGHFTASQDPAGPPHRMPGDLLANLFLDGHARLLATVVLSCPEIPRFNGPFYRIPGPGRSAPPDAR